jgi:hypothetical protein
MMFEEIDDATPVIATEDTEDTEEEVTPEVEEDVVEDKSAE